MNDFELVSLNRQELLAGIRHDCVTFFAFYLQDQLEYAVPELHLEIWNELLEYLDRVDRPGVIQVLQKLFAVPRGFAKTTVAKLAVILFLKYTRLKFVLYVSKTNGHAKNAIRDILGWLTSPQEAQLFGPLTTIKSSETDSLWIVDICCVDYRTMKVTRKRCIFRALGARQHVRGLNIDNQRPDLIVLDDVEDNDNTTTELQPELDTWLMGTLMKAFARNAFVIFIGNMIRSTTMLARLTKEPDWSPTVYGAIVRNKATGRLESLWEDMFPIDMLLREYATNRRLGVGHVFETEMMNLTQDAVFGADLGNIVQPMDPLAEDIQAGFMVLDPAFGDGTQHDSSAITVHAQLKNQGVPCVIDSWVGKASEDTLFDQMVEMSLRWGIRVWFIESVAAQRLFISYFGLLMRIRKMNPTAILILPIVGGKKSKGSRIRAFINSVKSRSYGLTQSMDPLVTKLRAYSDEVKHEDEEDSAAYGLIAWATQDTTIRDASGITVTLNTLYSDPDDPYSDDLEADSELAILGW